MKKLFVAAFAAVVSMMSTVASAGMVRVLEPDHKIGNLFCYKAWMGDRWEGGHIMLTDKPLRHLPPVAKNDPVGLSGKSQYGTKVIEINIDYLDSDYKRVSYNDHSFYSKERVAAESCFRKLFPGEDKKVKKTEVKFLPKKKFIV